MAQGTRLTEMAREQFPEGVLIGGENSREAIQLTKNAIAAGAAVIFEAALFVDGLYARVDVLTKLPGRKPKWKVTEIKSSLELKPDKHLPDLAFQVYVAQRSGLDVTDASVITLNRDYRHGSDDAPLFAEHPAWKFLRKALKKIEPAIEAARSVEQADSAPAIEVGRHCRSPYECPFLDTCRSSLPARHISWIPRIKKPQEEHLREAGVTTYDQLPEDFDATALQWRFIRGECDGQRYIGDRLRETLESLAYPIAFIDFEAVQPGLPVIMGTAPYERIPFQWSCHVMSHPEHNSQHREFLAHPEGDPRERFAETLLEAISDAATVMYYSPYEPATVEGLVQAGVPFALEVQDVLRERGVDLLELVQEHLYLPQFQGRFSIKKVLPALVPGFDYGDLAIQGGELAALTYYRMLQGAHPSPEEAREALRRYCERDTEAMVRVFQAMRTLALEAG